MRRVVFTLLLAAVAIVSTIGIFESARRALSEDLDLTRWFLLAVTLLAAGLALVRGLRFYASRSLLAPLVPDSDDSAPRRSSLWQRMPAAMDDVTWFLLASAVVVLNVLAVIATVAAVGELFGDGDTPLAWLIWQIVVLVVALAGLTRLSMVAAGELRDRSRRRRRGFAYTLTRRLIDWPGGGGGRRAAAAGAVAIPCLLTAIAWANASGPLLGQPGGEGPSGHRGPGPSSPASSPALSAAVVESPAATGTPPARRRENRAGQGRRGGPHDIAYSPAGEQTVTATPPPVAEPAPPPLPSEPPPAAEPATSPQAGSPAPPPRPPRLSTQTIAQGGEAPPEEAPPPEATTPPEPVECPPPAGEAPVPAGSPPPHSKGEPTAPATPPGQPCPSP